MKIEAFVLCDAATDQRGKLNVLGVFDSIYAKKVPAVHPSCAVALRVRFERIEGPDHSIKISIIDQDGGPIGPGLEGNISLRFRDSADSAFANLVLNIQRLKLENYGKYRIDLAVDKKLEASLPLYLAQLPEQAAPEE